MSQEAIGIAGGWVDLEYVEGLIDWRFKWGILVRETACRNLPHWPSTGAEIGERFQGLVISQGLGPSVRTFWVKEESLTSCSNDSWWIPCLWKPLGLQGHRYVCSRVWVL